MTPPEPLWHLVYRYWFWHWLFADTTRGDLLRRAAAWRHNLAQRVHLPVYMRRWSACLAVTFVIAALIEMLDARVLAAFFYVAAILAAVVEVNAGVAWIFLRNER